MILPLDILSLILKKLASFKFQLYFTFLVDRAYRHRPFELYFAFSFALDFALRVCTYYGAKTQKKIKNKRHMP